MIAPLYQCNMYGQVTSTGSSTSHHGSDHSWINELGREPMPRMRFQPWMIVKTICFTIFTVAVYSTIRVLSTSEPNGTVIDESVLSVGAVEKRSGEPKGNIYATSHVNVHVVEPHVIRNITTGNVSADNTSSDDVITNITDPFLRLGPVLNPHNYGYLIDPIDSCSDPDIFLVSYVHTAPGHYGKRAFIRRTWANASRYKNAKIQVFFMVGKTKTKTDQAIIERESEKYHDIVQEDFLDSYHNLSIKAVGAMRWVTTRCKQAKFILKIDDDIFVNMFTLLQHLIDLHTHNVSTRGLLMCLVWTKMHIQRAGKWGIPLDVIKGDYYPHYCSGMAYVMSPDVAESIAKASERVPFFWVDDVYITGLVPNAIGLKHVDIGRLMFGKKEAEWLIGGKDWYKYLFSCHLSEQKLQESIWKIVKYRFEHESIPQMIDVVAGNVATNYGPKLPPKDFKPTPFKLPDDDREQDRDDGPQETNLQDRLKKFAGFFNLDKNS